MSTPNDEGTRRRALARKAFYKDYSNKSITVKFVMGTKFITDKALIKQLESEQREFQDLVLLTDHVDTYSKLPNKVISSIQWAVENEQFDYCAGSGYVFGSKLVHLLAKYGHSLARDFTSEDAAMGLWLAPFHLQLLHDPLFSIYPSCEMNSYTIHQTYRFEVVANRLIKSGTLCSWSEKLQRMWFL